MTITFPRFLRRTFRFTTRTGFAALGLVLAAAACEAQENSPWATALPEEVGLDSAPLVEMLDFIRNRQIPVHSIQIVRHGRLVLDAYFYPYSAQTLHDVASVTKSMTSTLVGLAIDKGMVKNVRELALDLFPTRVAQRIDSRKKKLTIEHLLTMQAGWDCGFEPNEARLLEMRRSADWLQFMLDLPMIADPGTRWAYCSGNCHLLSVMLTQATKTNALAFARRELFEPLGISNSVWAADSGNNNHGWGDLQLHPRDMAKLGQLFLQRGRWGNAQIISKDWVVAATSVHVQRTINDDHYGYFWWVKGGKLAGMFEAVGRGGQRINVWPAKDLVLVFTGGGFEPGDISPFILKALQSDESLASNVEASKQLQQRLLDATQSPTPQPPAALPEIAKRISRLTFRLSSNSLKFESLSLEFDGRAEARLRLRWNGRDMNMPLGLDGVERFSQNRLIDLPQATKGQWLDNSSFLLDLNLVGGINHYSITLSFSEDGRKLNITLSERTGLNKEQFTGSASD